MGKALSPATLLDRKHHPYREPKKKQGKTRRACLACEAVFWSVGPQNRLCKTCRQRDAGAEPAVLPRPFEP